MNTLKSTVARNPRSKAARALLVPVLVWAVLSLIVFIGMRNYPELPGQKVPKPWMLSVFLVFLVSAGVWAHVYFGSIHHRVRRIVGKMLGIRSRAGSMKDGNLLVTIGSDDWQTAAGTPFYMVLLFTVFEWAALVIGIVIPFGLLLTVGAVLTGYLSEQLTGREIAAWLGL